MMPFATNDPGALGLPGVQVDGFAVARARRVGARSGVRE